MTHGLDFHILTWDNREQSIDCQINDQVYRYHFQNQDFTRVQPTVNSIQKKSKGKALAWIKKNCSSWEKLT